MITQPGKSFDSDNKVSFQKYIDETIFYNIPLYLCVFSKSQRAQRGMYETSFRKLVLRLIPDFKNTGLFQERTQWCPDITKIVKTQTCSEKDGRWGTIRDSIFFLN